LSFIILYISWLRFVVVKVHYKVISWSNNNKKKPKIQIKVKATITTRTRRTTTTTTTTGVQHFAAKM